MMIKNKTEMHLKPVFALHGYTSIFEGETGRYICEIRVESGTVEFIHGAYNVETGAWDLPAGKEPERIVIHENEVKKIEFVCGKHDGQKDCILISNNSYLKPADFTCSYELSDALDGETSEASCGGEENRTAA